MKAKKLLSLFLALVMMLSMCSVTAFADTTDNSDAVAEISGVSYATLAEAIAAAEDGDTVTLLADVELEDSIDVTGVVTLDLNGHTISAAEGATASNKFTANSAHDYLIGVKYNAVLVVVDYAGGGAVDGSDLLVGIKLTTKGEVFDEETDESASLVIGEDGEDNDFTITGGTYGISGNGNRHYTSLEVYGGTIEGEACTGIYQPQNGYLMIFGGTIKGHDSAVEVRAGGDFGDEYGEIQFWGGTYVVTGEDEYSVAHNGSGTSVKGAAIAISQHTTKQDINVYVYADPEESAFDWDINEGQVRFAVANPEGNDFDNVKILVDGKEDSFGDSYELPDGFHWYPAGEADDEDYVELLQSVAEVLDSNNEHKAYYASLADAIEAVPTDGTETTIVMIADETISDVASVGLTVAASKNIVLDLNGKTVSGVSSLKSTHFIDNKGILEITDSSANEDGKITFCAVADTGYSVENVTIYNIGGQLTLTKGTIENTTNGGLTYAVNTSSNAWGTGDDKYSEFTMTGGRLAGANTDNTLRVYQNCAVGNVASHNTVSISGGVIDNGIFVDTFLYNGNANTANYVGANIDTRIDISGGTINGLVDLKIRHPFNTVLNITGGDFTNAKFQVRKNSEYNAAFSEPTDPMVNISGGNFTFADTGMTFLPAYSSTTTSWTTYANQYSLTGGTFNLDPSGYVAKGYKAVDNGNGTWTVSAANYVAQIGNAKYETLAEAVEVAQDGETIELLADVNVGNAVVFISKSITLDGGNHTLTTTASRAIRINHSNVDVTIKDLEIVGSSDTERAVQVDSNMSDVTLNLNNITATATYYTVNICGSVDDLVLNIDNCDLTGWGVINLWGNNGTVNVSNSTLVGINDKSYNADGWNDFGVIILEGDTTGQTDEHSTAYDVTVTNCSITATSTTGNTQYVLLHNNPSANNNLALDSCTITLGTNCEFYRDNAVESVTKIKGTFISGTNNVPTLPEGYVYAPINDDYQLITQAVAEVNGVGYPTLEDALAAAPSGSTVKLLADIDYSKTYTVRNARDNDNGHAVDLRDLTLDLDGHTIASINGTVTFGGNGATITNGTFDLVEKNTDGSHKDGSYALIIDNDVLSYDAAGTVTVEDVTVDGGFNVCCATVTLDNVTAHTTTTKFYAVWAETNATLTINSGTFTDGQAKGTGVIATGKNAEGGAVVYVKGGTFTGVNKLKSSGDANSVIITGGTFNLDPSAYVADGYEAVEVTPGTWQVGEIKASAIAPADTNENYDATYTATKQVISTDGEDKVISEATDVTVNVKVITEGTVASDTELAKIDEDALQGIISEAIETVNTTEETIEVRISIVSDEGTTNIEENTITYEVHPIATAIVNNVEVGSVAIGNDALADGASFTITLPVPPSIAVDGESVKVSHISDDGENGTEIGTYKVVDGAVTLVVTHFSRFELAPDDLGTTATARYSATLTLNNNIDVNFYVYDLSGEAENYTVEFTFDGEKSIVPFEAATYVNNGVYGFVAASCRAEQMGDTINIVVKYNGTTIYSLDYSVKTYCERQIRNSTDQTLIDLCKSTLEYGAYAQMYFNYKTDALVTEKYSANKVVAGASPIDSTFNVTGSVNTGAAFSGASATLTLASETEVNFYFKPATGYAISDYQFTVTKGSEEVTPIISAYDGWIVVTVKGFAATELNDAVEVTGTNCNSGESKTITYSPMSYAYRMQSEESTGTICQALYYYYLAAKAYFEANP